jgi:flavin-dependent dehydrogenase
MESATGESGSARSSETYDIVVVGGGVAGCFAAATAADQGADVVQLERKSEAEAGHIACGDAMKSPTDSELYPGPIDMAAIAATDDVLIDENIDQIEWWDEAIGVKKVLPYDSGSNVVDRYAFGRELLEQTAALGVDQHFDTVVNGVLQDDQVEGVEAVRDGAPVTYHADLVVDAGGSLSTVMAAVDFDDLAAAPETSFEEPHYQQFGAAYREILRTPEDVPYDNALVGKPLEEMGYIWYFPRTPREINVGLGFQMNKDPIELVDRLREDVQDRPEYQGAEHDEVNGTADKLGAALGLDIAFAGGTRPWALGVALLAAALLAPALAVGAYLYRANVEALQTGALAVGLLVVSLLFSGGAALLLVDVVAPLELFAVAVAVLAPMAVVVAVVSRDRALTFTVQFATTTAAFYVSLFGLPGPIGSLLDLPLVVPSLVDVVLYAPYAPDPWLAVTLVVGGPVALAGSRFVAADRGRQTEATVAAAVLVGIALGALVGPLLGVDSMPATVVAAVGIAPPAVYAAGVGVNREHERLGLLLPAVVIAGTGVGVLATDALGFAGPDWGLAVALGGGVGVVSNLLAAEAQGEDDDQTESMTVDMETDDSPSPRPADLFDDHPDPVLYVADRGHGPVVLAANGAFAETFDVPADAISETPLDESILADEENDPAVETVVDAVASGDAADETLSCRTPSGPVRFRLRTAGGGADGYVIYTRTEQDE